MRKPNGDTRFICKVNSVRESEDSTCSILYELQVGDEVYPKGISGNMNMNKKFGSFQAYFLYENE